MHGSADSHALPSATATIWQPTAGSQATSWHASLLSGHVIPAPAHWPA